MKRRLFPLVLILLLLTGCVSESEYKELASRVEYLESLHGVDNITNSSAETIRPTISSSEEENDIEDVIGTATVETASLNVRSSPAQTSTRIGALVSGQTADVMGITEDEVWAKIKFNGQIGYVKTEFIDISYINPSHINIINSEPEFIEDVNYEKIDLGGVETTYPTRGIIGLKNDKDGKCLEIESITIESSSGHSGDSIWYSLNFIGTNPYSNAVSFTVKQYDKDGFCISEESGRVQVVCDERVRESGIFRIYDKAATAIIEIKASANVLYR